MVELGLHRANGGTRLKQIVGRALSAVLDPTVVLSFDRTGYRVHSLAFEDADLDVDLSGRVCLVTGAASGIGFAIAKGLGSRGAEVWLLCRSLAKGEDAAGRIRHTTPRGTLRPAVLDVSSLASVRELVATFDRPRVDVLVHNAGVLPAERSETDDGLELTFATHVAGPFALTHALVPKLSAARGRVIWVSSGGMYTQRLSLADPQWRRRPYDGTVAYAETKRMQVVLSELFAERLKDRGISVHAMHPGWADTPGVRTSIPRFHRATRWILRTPDEGADTALWLAVADRPVRTTGLFWFDRRPRGTHFLPFTRESSFAREALWALCERLTAGTGGENPS